MKPEQPKMLKGVFEAGQIISRKTLFGDGKRYAVFAVQTRYHDVEWFVADAETPDRDGRPDIIRQSSTFEDAIAGLY